MSSADLDLYPEDVVSLIAERLKFGDAVERALDGARPSAKPGRWSLGE